MLVRHQAGSCARDRVDVFQELETPPGCYRLHEARKEEQGAVMLMDAWEMDRTPTFVDYLTIAFEQLWSI